MRVKGYKYILGLALVWLALSIGLAACGDAAPATTPGANANVAAPAKDGKTYTVGIFLDGQSAGFNERFGGLKDGLKNLGYEEGKNINFIQLNTTGMATEQEETALKEFAAKNYDAYWLVSGIAGRKIKPHVTQKPIIICGMPDAVVANLVKAVEQPGVNITGIDNLNTQLTAKRLEMLKRINPALEAVYVVHSKANAQVIHIPALKEAAEKLNVKVIEKVITSKEESAQIVPNFKASEAQAILPIGVSPYGFSGEHFKEVVEREKLMLVGMDRTNLNTNALFSYGANNYLIGKQSTEYLFKVLRGSNPATMPVLQPDKIELLLNQKIADKLGIKIPDAVVSSADEIVK
jgi:putative tryptophan/tyrosine transport system substrate-binding protein